MIEANQQTEPTVEKQENKGQDKVITVSQIILDLDSGLGRPQIKEKYSLNADEMKHLFQHPSLKKRRPKRALNKINFTLVDDVTPTDDSQLRVDVEAERTSEDTTEGQDDEFDAYEIVD